MFFSVLFSLLFIIKCIRRIKINNNYSLNILSSQAFIVTIWAILLNTILGPIAVGLMVKLLGSKLTDGLWVD